jgi:hypothetical protein
MDKNSITPSFPMPLRGLLLLTGMYTFAWSAFFRYFGDDYLKWLSMDPVYLAASQTNVFGIFGMILGFLIFMSAFYPISWQYLIWVGIIGHLALLIWVLVVFIPDLGWNKRTVFQIGFNQIIWVVLLTIIWIRSVKVKKYLQTIEN